MKNRPRAATFLRSVLALSVLCAGAKAADPIEATRLYALDCGSIEFKDMAMFSDTGEYDGKPGRMVDPCFLVRHPKGDLIWDTGLGDGLAKLPQGSTTPSGIHVQVTRTLVEQLASIGLAPGDIEFLGLSHLHFDHTGNANLLTRATWLLEKRELDWALSKPTPLGIEPETLAGHKRTKVEYLSFDHDVFGDGSVRILRAPGHTPGHRVLMLKLAKAKTVILSGDLYHTRDNVKEGRVPAFNESRADTLSSFQRVLRLIRNESARLIVQHAPEDFAALPVFPAYLD